MSADQQIIHWQHIIYSRWYWLAIGLGLLIVVITLALFVLQLIDFWHLHKQKTVFFELIPPSHRDKVPLATEQLFSVLHGLEANRSRIDKLLLRKVVLSLEVASTRERGIRFIACIRENDAAVFRHTITSYLQDARIEEVADYLPANSGLGRKRLLSFKQTGHFAYPLESHTTLPQHDPISFLTGMMTKLNTDELIAVQVVVAPATSYQAHQIEKRILSGKDARARLRRGHNASVAMRLIKAIVLLTIYLIRGFIYAFFFNYELKGNNYVTLSRSVSPAEQDLIDSLHDKLRQPLFRVDIRAYIHADSNQRSNERVKALKSSLASFTKPRYQSLKARGSFPAVLRCSYREFQFRSRLPSLFHRNACLLAASELAALYHFPHSVSANTENVVKSLSRTLPAPIALKNGYVPDVLLGVNTHQSIMTPIGLTAAERERHIYIIGGTGNGKTTMLMYAMLQDMSNGKGVAVVDPHGDLAATLLKYIPEERIKDVIYLNPVDIAHPIGLNLLELPEGLSPDEYLNEKDRVTESVISVFRKIFSEDDSGGHRVEYVLRNTIHTAFTVKDATIFTVFQLLTDSKYQRAISNKLEDEFLRNFWKQELGKAGDFQRVKMSAGVTSKIGRFRFNESAKRMLEQPRSTINFEDILDSGKILICNFSKGLLGEDTAALFGTTVLAKLQLAAERRARTEQSKRKPFHLYVDEFQNFATLSFVQMLSESRKYKLFLTMAEQSPSQQDEQRMVNIILANVGTVISFRSGSPKDEDIILPLFTPYIEKGEIANLPTFNFYARIAAVHPQEPLSGETVLLDDEGSEEIATQVITSSRKLHAMRYVGPKIEKVDTKPIGSGTKTKHNSKMTVTSVKQTPIIGKAVRHRSKPK